MEITAQVGFPREAPKLERALDLDGIRLVGGPWRGADMIYWKRKQGGIVFNVGSMTFGGSLSADRKVHSLMVTVLKHFGITYRGKRP